MANKELNESLLTCSFSILLVLFTFAGHGVLQLYYWYRTGTFPLRERVRSRVVELNELRDDHKHPEHESL